MKSFIYANLFVIGLGLLTLNLSALDTFYEPAKWDLYQERVLRLREHEKLAFARPAPGTHPIVAMQTLVLPEFKADNVTVSEAFDLLARACEEHGVRPTFYVDSTVMRSEPRISYEAAKGDTVAKTLRYLMTISRTHIHLSGNNILLWSYDETLDPCVVSYGVYVLSEKAAEYCGLSGTSTATTTEKWVSVEQTMMKQGIPFPAGTYADYRPDIHSMVVINAAVTLGSLANWLREIENRVVIESTKGRGITAIDDYKLETRSYPVSKQMAQKTHGWLMDEKNKLAPFAHDTADLVSFRTTLSNNQTGSAAWLDVKSLRLWVRNRLEDLDDFEKGLEEWLERLEANPAYGIKPSKK